MANEGAGRKRGETIAFRVDRATAVRIGELARLSGLSKQDYLAAKALDESVVVNPSSRVSKSLTALAEGIYSELLATRREGRAVGDDAQWAILTFASLLQGFSSDSARDMDAEIAEWRRK